MMGRGARNHDAQVLLITPVPIHICPLRYRFPAIDYEPIQNFRFMIEAYSSRSKAIPVHSTSGDSAIMNFLIPIVEQ